MKLSELFGKTQKADAGLDKLSNDELVAKKKSICSKISNFKGNGNDSAIDNLWNAGMAIHQQLKTNVGDDTKGP